MAVVIPPLDQLGAVFVIAVVLQQAIRSFTDWTLRSVFGYLRSFVVSETTSRTEKQGNEKSYEINNQLEERLSRKEDEISNYERLISGLKSKNISKNRIIEGYWKPLPAIIITFFKDYTDDSDDGKFLKSYIKRNNQAEMLTGNTYAIPPKGFPDRFEDPSKVGRPEIEEWFKEDVLGEYPEGKAVICQASTVDLRRVYSHTDYDSHSFARKTIESALDIESILQKNNIHRALARDKVNLSKAIEEGDIAFLLSRYVSSDELDQIHQHQDEIEAELGDPPLRSIAEESFIQELADAISPYVQDPHVPAKSAVEEAQMWHTELQS